jgi:hypothetical protein
MENINFDQDLESIIKDNQQFRFQLELSKTHITDRKTTITNILNSMNKSTNITSKTKSSRDMFIENIDKQIYSQPWHKLKDIHKEKKVIEFLDKKYPNNSKLKELVLKELEKGQFNTTKHVKYDSKKMVIDDIMCIKEGIDKNYSINLKK